VHELSLVEELVETCRDRARGRAVHQVSVRCPTTVDADELSTGFALASGPLSGPPGEPGPKTVDLKLEIVPVRLSCACGCEGELTSADLAGHMSVCPRCGRVDEADARLELISMTFAEAVEPFGTR
jgi:Zn finger protein HypA/HybF involved in hydrogenase expression